MAETPAALTGPSFSRPAKAIALALVVAAFAMGFVVREPVLAQVRGTMELVFVGAAMAWLLVMLVAILRSTTTVDATHIVQHGLTRRQVAFSDVIDVRFVRLPGMDWLITPRLTLRLRQGGSRTFHAADPRLLVAVLERLPLPGQPAPAALIKPR